MKKIKKENYKHYETEGRNNYYAVDQYNGESCTRCVFTGKKKDAELVAVMLNDAYRQGIFDSTGQWTKY